MKPYLTLLAAFIVSMNAFSQVEVKVNDQRPSALIETIKQDRMNLLNQSLVDSLYSSKADSLNTKVAGVGIKVFSEKYWNQYADSLKNLPFVNEPQAPYEFGKAPKDDISKEELLKEINDRYFSSKGRNTTSPQLNDSIEKGNGKGLSKINEPGITPPPADLASLKLPDSTLQDLKLLSANLIDSKYIDKIDSIRRLSLKAQGLQLEEKKLPVVGTQAQLQKKPTFWNKTYFEGLLGVSGGDRSVVQASPALGYHFTKDFSFGLGPNLNIHQEAKSIEYALGFKTLVKYEIFDRHGYLQVEDLFNTRNAGKGIENTGFKNQHNLFVGGGWLLSLSAPITLNLSLLYRITDHGAFATTTSPWVFRIGISTVKMKDK